MIKTELTAVDPSKIGQAEQFQNPVEAYDARYGKYADAMPAMPTEAKLPTQQMPMAPVAAPFVIKGAGGGER